LLEKIHDTAYQRFFRPDYDHVNSIGHYKFFYGWKIHHREGHIGAAFCRAGVAGGYEKPGAVRVLGKFPGYGVFAAAAAKEKDLHGWI
jgi:hypothetical protein